MVEQSELFALQDEEGQCAQFLKKCGYLVLPPSAAIKKVLSMRDYSSITNINSLIDFFYKRLIFYNQHRDIHYNKASSSDKIYAKSLLKSRIETGVNKKRAFVESAIIIEVLLQYEDFFGLDKPISSMKVLGQNNYKWVTDMIISFINKEKSNANELLEDMKMEEAVKQWGREDYGIGVDIDG